MRVVSLFPSATESLCFIGGESLLVGRSHECDSPESIRSRPILTSQRISESNPPPPGEIDRVVRDALRAGEGLYRLDIPRLQALRPDLILAQDLCSVCSIDPDTVRAAAAQLNHPPDVLSLNPTSFEGVLDDLLTIGAAVGRLDQAHDALAALRQRFARAADCASTLTDPPRVVFLDWTDPPFVAGHWTPQLIERAGGSHPLNATVPMPDAGAGAGGHMAHRTAGPSRQVSPEEIAAAEPEVLIICPCGVGLDGIDQHLAAIIEQDWFRSLPAVRRGRVALVDGNQMFSRPGPRLVDAFEWMVGYLNDRPDLFSLGFPWRPVSRF